MLQEFEDRSDPSFAVVATGALLDRTSSFFSFPRCSTAIRTENPPKLQNINSINSNTQTKWSS
jgi:hypothetical protein